MTGNPDSTTPGSGGSLASPTGGTTIPEERLEALAGPWSATYASIRRMDEFSLGELEPAMLFVWEEEEL